MMKNIQLNLQIFSKEKNIPAKNIFLKWIGTVFNEIHANLNALIVRIVDINEISTLNEKFRHRKGSTNVLSFEAENIPGFKKESLGEIVICAPIVEKEAIEQNKNPQDHWAHIVIHGVLHLLGYDHKIAADAKKMELLEIKVLKELNIQNPYE